MTRKFGLLFVALLVCHIALADETVVVDSAAVPTVVSETSVPVVEPTAINQVSTDPASGLVSLDFREADIRNVLEVLALKSGMNIVASPEVTGTVSIQLNNVPWKQALDVILQTYGYAYDLQGNIIVVTTIDDLKKRRENAVILSEQEPLSTEIYTLNFARASEVITSIEKMLSSRGTMDFDERTNTVIVHDTQKHLENISTVIKKLDQTTPQVAIEAKIVETTLTNSEELGIDWSIQGTANLAKRPHTFPFGDQGDIGPVAGSFPGTTASDFSYGTLNLSQVQAVFEMLKSRSDTNILSNPKITTLDNRPAEITVGSQYPIPTYTYNEDQAKLQVSGWEYKDIGIIFKVTPHVSSAGYVSLSIEPKITAILDFVTVENTSLPRLSNESAKTDVMIKDGETVVIAGLIKDQTTTTRKRVPILGDIPLLGYPFRKNEDTRGKTDLMIFLTPHIITPQIP